VAGTHGKTTTSAMIVQALRGQQPSYIVGGILRNTGHNAGVGRGRAFVIEADEYDYMFLGLRPHVAVVTSIEYDHPDFFATPSDLTAAFTRFVDLLPPDGLLIACMDDPAAAIMGLNRLVAGLPVATYGIDNPQAEWRAVDVRIDSTGLTVFEVMRGGRLRGTVRLIVPGRHNVLNALAALIAADHQGVPFADAAVALREFRGTGRRFEVRGEVGGVVVIDDYAHHPTAIRFTLAAARARFPGSTIWAVWQPHTYSRTAALLEEYAVAFSDADQVIVTDIYAAREAPVPGVSGAETAAVIDHPAVQHVADLREAARLLDGAVSAPAVILIMSAGDAPVIGVEFLKLRRAHGGGDDT
jgi:UDP-N-acetylmuramate--alanine ligase